jgi:Domain of unknown function (DUF4037)
MAEFVPGVELGRALYREVVAPRLGGVRHSAARLGTGSDVLGYDTARSTDHDWGARLVVLVEAGGPEPLDGVPAEFRGWPTEVVVVGIGTFLTWQLGFDPRAGISTRDWLVTPQQSLASVTAGAVYHDGLGELEPVRRALAWYPRDLWLWQLAGQWRRIAQEEHFPGRAAEVGDDLGRRVLVARLARDVMRLCFLLERRYAPYSKWVGTAFGRLESAAAVGPLLSAAMAADRWPAAEGSLVGAYREVAERHNRLGLTEPLDPGPRRFHDRPWLVLDADRFVAACLEAMADRALASFQPIGAIDQFVDSTDVLGFRPALCRRVGRVYGLATPPSDEPEEVGPRPQHRG